MLQRCMRSVFGGGAEIHEKGVWEFPGRRGKEDRNVVTLRSLGSSCLCWQGLCRSREMASKGAHRQGLPGKVPAPFCLREGRSEIFLLLCADLLDAGSETGGSSQL